VKADTVMNERMRMQKLINRPDDFVDEMLEGVLAAHPDQLKRGADPRAIVRADAPVQGKVAIATGGGSGHLPVFMGYVGRGLADGAAIGNVFASPSADQMLAVMRSVDGGAGVLQLYGNYGGDVMNFGLAAELAEAEGIKVATVLGADDVASAPKGEEARRRGIAGIFFLYKVAGARAQKGGTLAEVTAATEKAASRVRSMGVALAPCTVPSAGRPTFELPAGEMEIGMGIHGEPGVRRGQLEPADRVVDDLMQALVADLPHDRGDRVDVLVNGLGATPVEELYVMFRRAADRLGAAGLKVRRAWVGEYATSLEMAGASISLMRMDGELEELMDAPADSPFFVRR
jgi:dihydroxyacetone kinase-like protein